MAEKFDKKILEALSKEERKVMLDEITKKFSDPGFKIIIDDELITSREEFQSWMIKNRYLNI